MQRHGVLIYAHIYQASFICPCLIFSTHPVGKYMHADVRVMCMKTPICCRIHTTLHLLIVMREIKKNNYMLSTMHLLRKKIRIVYA